MQQVCGRQIAKPDFWTTRLPIRQTYTLVCPLSYRPRVWDILVKRRIGDAHSIRNLFIVRLPSRISAFAAAMSCSDIALGRPPICPRIFAATSPAAALFRMTLRLNLVNALKIWSNRRPMGVVASIASVKDRNPQSFQSSNSTVEINWVIDLASRSSFQTTSACPGRT